MNILVGIVRSKLTAVLLGPSGMGLIFVLTSAIGLVGTLTNFGLATIATKDITVADASGNRHLLNQTIEGTRILVWLTGGFGLLVMLSVSRPLSLFLFDSPDYAFHFFSISVCLLLAQLNTGYFVILQGLRKFRFLAKANVVSGITIVVFVIPFYYFWGESAIIYSIVLYSLIPVLINRHFAKEFVSNVKIGLGRLFVQARHLISFGSIISFSRLMPVATTFLLNAYLTNAGSLALVGLYTAGFAIVNQYANLVFNAMEPDYFTRLARCSKSENPSYIINQQIEVAVLLISPIILVFIVFAKVGIRLLYSNEFEQVFLMMQFTSCGLLFKTVGWALGQAILARGNPRNFLLQESLFNAILCGSSVIAYRLNGLDGLGQAFVFTTSIHILIAFIITKSTLNYHVSREVLLIVSRGFLIVVTCFVCVYLLSNTGGLIIGSLFIVLGAFLSFRTLDEKIDILSLVKKKFAK